MTELAPGTRMAEWLEQAWVERYLARQLGDAEANWFEAYILDKADLLQQVEADTDLRDAVSADPHPEDSRRDLGVRIASSARTAAPTSPQEHRRSSWTFSRPLAMAASLVLALLAGWIGNARLGTQGEPDVVALPTRIVFDTMRGSAATSRVENRESTSRQVLVEVGLPARAEEARLLLEEKQTTLKISADGFASFLIDRKTALESDGVAVRYRVDGRESTLPLDIRAAMGGEPAN